MIAILLYFIPVMLLVTFFHRDIRSLVGVLTLPDKEKEKRIVDYVQSRQELSVDELQRLEVWGSATLKKIVIFIGIVFLGPPYLLRLAVLMKYGQKVDWKSPIDIFNVWFASFLLLSYYYTDNDSYYISLSITMTLLVLLVGVVVMDFSKKGANLRIYSYPKHKIRVSASLQHAFLILISFSSIYYTLSAINRSAFSRSLSAYDSLVYSLNTLVRNPFLDIRPISRLAEAVVSSRIAS
jgi:hypothetical protein